MADLLFRLGYVRKGHLVSVTRDDLVGQYIGHTAPKTKEDPEEGDGRRAVHRRSLLHCTRPDNERDYGQEAIEILLQVMENQRDDLVVILAGYADRMDKFYQSNPGFRSRIAHHIDFSDCEDAELLSIADTMLAAQNYHLDPAARQAMSEYVGLRRQQPPLRQCALDPQRTRSRAPPSGQSSSAQAEGPVGRGTDHHHGRRYPAPVTSSRAVPTASAGNTLTMDFNGLADTLPAVRRARPRPIRGPLSISMAR